MRRSPRSRAGRTADLKQLWVDANVLVQISRSEHPRRSASVGRRWRSARRGQKTTVQVRYSKPAVSPAAACSPARPADCCSRPSACRSRPADELDAELRQIAVLARAARTCAAIDNYLIRRAAILHSDVAMLAPASMVAPGERHPAGRRRRRAIPHGDLRRSGTESPPVGGALGDRADAARLRAAARRRSRRCRDATRWCASGTAPPRPGCS